MTYRELLAAVRKQPGYLASAKQKVRGSLVRYRTWVAKTNKNYTKEIRKLIK